MDNKPALNLFESIEPNGAVELEGLGTVNLSHFPYREDLAYGWPDDAVRFHDQALPFDGRKLLYCRAPASRHGRRTGRPTPPTRGRIA